MDNTFQVQGMTCGHCEMAVKKAIARLDPDAKVEIDRSPAKSMCTAASHAKILRTPLLTKATKSHEHRA